MKFLPLILRNALRNLEGMIFAAIMGTIGGFLPARLASRLTIVRALRTEV